MSAIPAATDVLDPSLAVLTLSDVAERLDFPMTRVRQLLRDGHLLAVRRDNAVVVPADFLGPDGMVKHLQSTVTVLRDSGFTPEEMLRWLFTEDDTLPGRPIDALRENRSREIKRRAQALAF